jgi:hypothetical protein
MSGGGLLRGLCRARAHPSYERHEHDEAGSYGIER